MPNYKTVKDCAADIICTEGDRLTNKQIAEKVRTIMKSDTTDKSIAWYKNKINRGIVKIDKSSCKWLLKPETTRMKEIIVENQDEKNYKNEAEWLVFELEMKRTGRSPQKMPNNGPGYDFESGDRHIEVKGKTRKTGWLQLTANESDALIHDSKYYLYLVEGDIEKNPDEVKVYMIQRDELLAMAQLKIHVRLTQLSNGKKRQEWEYRG